MKLRQLFIAEFLGTFCLVFAGTGAIVVNTITHGSITHTGIAIVFGLVVMSMIFALGNTSGAHFNPAVTLGFVLSRRLKIRMMPVYMIAQCAGALIASLMIKQLFGDVALLGATNPTGTAMQSFGLEIILTAILMVVILCVATGSKEQGMLAGVAIGGVIGLEALFAGPICGASMNPVRSLAPAIISGHMTQLWIYLVAPFAGSVIGVVIWALMKPAEPHL